MRGAALPSGDLVIGRARLYGRGSRGALEAGLAHVSTGDIAGSEEILLISNLRASVALTPGRPASDFGTRLTDQLRALRATAEVDPSGPVRHAAALRFTSKARYASWLVSLWQEGYSAPHAGSAILPPEPAEIRSWLRREVISDGRVLVATSALLRSRRRLARWVARFDPGETALAQRALEAAYSLPSTLNTAQITPEITLAAKSAAGPPEQRSFHNAIRAGTARQGLQQYLAQTWTDLVASEVAVRGLDPPRARLVLQLTTLAERPNLGRQLVPTTLDWAVSGGFPEESHAAAAKLSRPPAQSTAAIASGHEPLPSLPVERQVSVVTQVTGEGKRPRAKSQVSAMEARRGRVSPAGREVLAPQEQPGSTEDRLLAVDIARQGFETEFGGVFFLLNVLLALELYPDFTRPLGKGLEPSPFWLLDRLALRMFGATYRRDPLHRWLQTVGLPGPLPSRWAVEPTWLRGLPRGTHAYRRSRVHSVLWDLRGFALVDAPAASLHTRRGWLKRYGEFGSQVARPALTRRNVPRNRDARWIACLTEFLTVRIGLASDELSRDSLRLRAGVVTDEERLTITFDLAELPVELRLAGFDRDPGWLPAEGCAVHFRFE